MTKAAAKAAPQNPVIAAIKSQMQLIFVMLALVVVYLYFMFAAPNFAQFGIFMDILLQAAFMGVMALGATFIIATSGIDLSVGTGMTFVAVSAGFFLSEDAGKFGLPLVVGLVLTLLVGACMGFINGVNVSLLGLPPFIATLAMMMVARGLSLVLSGSQTISIKNPGYIALSTGELIPGFTNAALIFIVAAIVAAFLMNKTLLGRYSIAIGSNEEATRLSGVNVRFWKILIYTVAGIFMALGAILYSARFGFVQPAEGIGFELNVIAAVVIGGTSLAGGRASIFGTVIGALLMETLKKGLTMMGVPSEWQLVVTGIVVLLAVFVDNIRRARAASV
ncbi:MULTISPECIES: ABC transporter permease [unclassified Schaalia]|uniref:ABC transporter permease n=1 Tax=unclassified Schaalia TaxID=2691889 RepID=UPI001E376B11|nr:ABC transporter permease [Schaalia sp. lx-260]MCD4557774.1 ABC transporter permease [Schaalia sp. lx-100]